jgi:hypothetical protein
MSDWPIFTACFPSGSQDTSTAAMIRTPAEARKGRAGSGRFQLFVFVQDKQRGPASPTFVRGILLSTTMSSSSTATVFIPDPFHPDAEAYAEKRFNSVLRTGHGLDRSACLAASDGIRAPLPLQMRRWGPMFLGL